MTKGNETTWTTWTPGPWTVEVVRDEVLALATKTVAWGLIHRPGTHSIETNLADARLIAKAPEMVEVLQFLADDSHLAGCLGRAVPWWECDCPVGRARALLREIKGE